MIDTGTYYRRHLPHWQPPGATIFLTWRLYGSLPCEALECLAQERKRLERQSVRPAETPHDRSVRHGKQLLALTDDLLAANIAAPHWLSEARIAQLVTDAFFFHAGKLYTLLAFVVMPNHIHLLLTPLSADRAGESESPYVSLAKITQSLKGYTAREANRLLARTDQPFWQGESYDHWARTAAELDRIATYIESDPVRSGLVTLPEVWRWSSSWEREHGRLR